MYKLGNSGVVHVIVVVVVAVAAQQKRIKGHNFNYLDCSTIQLLFGRKD